MDSTLDALKTYRYLRLALVVLVVLLGTSLALEVIAGHGSCWRTSISSYYYTPARAVLVGVLVAVGVCLVVLKGNTEVEDILLNIGGALAPVVAFVPVADPHECSSAAVPLGDAALNVANNVGALLVAGLIALVVTVVVAVRERMRGPASRAARLGILVSVLLYVAGAAWFLLGRGTFLRWAHYAAAIPLFVCFLLVVVLNARDTARRRAGTQGRPAARQDYVNRYLVVAVLMVGSLVVLLALQWLAGWDHALFWLEASQLALFAVFWVLQTRELWDEGVRGAAAKGPVVTGGR